MAQFRRWLVRNLDVLAFGAALASVGPLMAWWSILVRRDIVEMDRISRLQIEQLGDVGQRLAQLAELEQRTARQLFMISGETAMAGVLFVVLAIVLFAIARHRQTENRRMQTMLQLTSHQLKTPIAGVRMLLQSLASGAVPDALRPQLLSRGIGECDRLEHLVETILAFQRSLAHRAPRVEAISSDRLIGEILAHRSEIPGQAEARWAKRDTAVVECDPDAVRVVLENLLDNARKYGGGTVELTEALVGQRWRLHIRDGGVGFDPSHAERLFEPFEREEGTGAAHGSGLGLYIARQLALRMRGSLTAFSEGKGRGSTFTLELPLARAKGPAKAVVAHG